MRTLLALAFLFLLAACESSTTNSSTPTSTARGGQLATGSRIAH